MKKIFLFILICGSIFAQSGRIQVFKGSSLTANYIPIASDTNKIVNSVFYLDANNALNVPVKTLLDSLYSRTGDLYIEGIKFSNQNIDLPGSLTMYGDMVVGGYMNLNMLDSNWYGSKVTDGYILKFNADSSKWIPQAETSGSADTTHYVDVAKITGLQEVTEDYSGGMWTGNTETRATVTYQDSDGTIDIVVDDMNQDTTYLAARIALNTTHSSSNGTDHSYIDQDVTSTGTPTFDSTNVSNSLLVGTSGGAGSMLINWRGQTYPGLWMGVNTSSPSFTNYSFLYDAGSGIIFNAPSGKKVNFRVNNSGKVSIGTVLQVVDDFPLTLGTNDDFQIIYDETTNDRLELSDGTNDFLTITDAGSDADFNFIGRIESDGYKINTHTIVGDTTLTASMMYGGKFYIGANATVTLPAVADGMSASFKVMGVYTAHIDPNASDKLFLDDTALDDGDKASSGGTSGELIVIEYWSADGWDANSDGWSDGG